VTAPLRASLIILLVAAGATILAAGALIAGTSGAGEAAPLDPGLARSIASIEASLERLRGLAFTSRVATSALSRDGVGDYVRKILHEQYPPERLAAEEEAMRWFDLLGPGRGLEKVYVDLMSQQVAGLYDPPSKTLYVVPGMPWGSLALAHELDHALVDQHFDIDRLEGSVRTDDDRALALSALVEGEATMVMALWQVERSADPNAAPESEGDREEMMKAAEAGMKDVPPFLRDSLVFPYTEGMKWVGEVTRRGGGLKALDEYFRNPPDSTEQILHPEKSFPPRDVPSTIDPSLVGTGIPKGARPVKRDTMGEFAMRFILGGAPGTEDPVAAAGWDGDTYLLAGEPGAYLFNWISVWDAEEDAVRFETAAGAWLASREKAGGADRRATHRVSRKGRVAVVTSGDGAAPGSTAGERLGAILARLPEGIGFR